MRNKTIAWSGKEKSSSEKSRKAPRNEWKRAQSTPRAERPTPLVSSIGFLRKHFPTTGKRAKELETAKQIMFENEARTTPYSICAHPTLLLKT
jgi:hypothetical protein